MCSCPRGCGRSPASCGPGRAVKVARRWILGRLRDETFLSLGELNARIRELNEESNDRSMKRYGGRSRRALFEELERAALLPLPTNSHEYADWCYAKVHPRLSRAVRRPLRLGAVRARARAHDHPRDGGDGRDPPRPSCRRRPRAERADLRPLDDPRAHAARASRVGRAGGDRIHQSLRRCGAPAGDRTPFSWLRVRCVTIYASGALEPAEGVEPTASRLRSGCPCRWGLAGRVGAIRRPPPV